MLDTYKFICFVLFINFSCLKSTSVSRSLPGWISCWVCGPSRPFIPHLLLPALWISVPSFVLGTFWYLRACCKGFRRVFAFQSVSFGPGSRSLLRWLSLGFICCKSTLKPVSWCSFPRARTFGLSWSNWWTCSIFYWPKCSTSVNLCWLKKLHSLMICFMLPWDSSTFSILFQIESSSNLL